VPPVPSPRRGARSGRFLQTAALVLGAALGLAACSSTPSSNKPAVTTSTTTAPTPTTSPTTTTAALQACATNGVSVASSLMEGAAGTLVQRFAVTNSGSAPCSMNGEPFISPYGPQPQGGGQVEANLPVTVSPIPAGFGDLGGAGGQIVVAPGGTAVFFLKWSDVVSSTAACYQGDGFDFRTPQSADSVLVKFSFPGSICGGTLYVSQILSSSVTS
jgi:hypothetical protein